MSNEYNGMKRSELPDSVFGIPQERKYPMPDEKHTRSAIKLFNHVDPKYEEQLAKAVIKNMKKYGIDGSVVGPNNRLRKYLPEDMIKESILNEKENYDHLHSKSCINEASGTNKEIKKKDLDDMKSIIKSLKDDDYRDFEIRKNAYYFKIEYKDDKPVGFVRMIAMRDNKYEHCRVLDISLAVDPDYRKQGIARKLASEAIRKAKQDKSIYRIYWGALRSNIGSISLAKSLGFKEEPKYGDKEYIVFYLQIGKGIDVDKMNESAPMQLENKNITIIFDLGDVLVKSNMMEDLKNKYKFSNSDIKTILSHWFDDSYDLYDSNTFIETMERVLPDKFKSRIFDIILAFKNISLYPYTEKILSDIKRLGYKIYYFSNWSRWGVELLEDANKLRFLHEYFDGGMFSYETKYKKPHRRFYDIFIQKFKLQKSNIIFFDNKQDNINMGKNFGWTGYVVDENLDQYFHDMISSYTNESSILPQDTGISTVIFDIGDVLVSANIKDYLVADPEVPNEIVDELLKLWFIDKDEVDDTMDLDTYREIVNKRMGVEFSKYIPKLFQYNVDCVTAFDYTIPMIQDLKDKGYKVYYLSNWSAWTYDLLQEAGKFDFLKLMDGGVFSYDVGYMKPDEEIYKILLNKYKINPEEAMFFDDKEENIEAANKLGIHGVHFPRHDASIVYSNLYGRKLAKAIYEDMDSIRYDFEPGCELEATYKLFLETNSMAINLQYEASKELMKIIKPVILEDKEFKNRAKELHLALKCKLLPVKGSVISVLVLDGSQEYRDTPDARKLLNDIRASCIMIINKLSGLLKKYISKIDIGDGDEGCLYFHLNKVKAIVHDLKNKVVKEEEMDFPNVPIIFDNLDDENLTVNIQESLIEMAKREGIPVPIKDGNDIFEYYPPTKEKPYGEIGGVSISKGGFNESSIQESVKTRNQIGNKEIKDIKTIISSLEDDSFNDFKFRDIAYCDIRYKNKEPIAFITIRTKLINDSTVGYVSLAVNPKYQNQGIGRSLTKKAVSWFKKERGIHFLEWHCLQNNEASKKLANDACFKEYIAKSDDVYKRYTMESSIQEYGTTGGTIVGTNQPDSVYIVNYMQNNVFSGYKEPKQAICKKGMNQMYTTKNGKAVPVDKDKFKEEASDISVFRFKETPILSFDKIIENASVDGDFYMLLTGDYPTNQHEIEYDNRFVQEENFLDELDDITCCTESTITGQIETSNCPYMKVLTESLEGRCWNYYRDINGVFAMNELTGLRTPSYEDITDIPNSQIQLIERGTVYLGE